MTKIWHWLLLIALICVFLIIIPISYSGENSKEELQVMFNDYIEKFNKSYKNNATEYATRFQHFVASVREIEHLNSLSQGPEEHRARFGLTRLSDMSKDEYKDIHLSDEKMTKAPHSYSRSWSRNSYSLNDVDRHHRHRDSGKEMGDVKTYARKRRAALPLQVDWRANGVVGPVHDQGLCGACWAFSTIGTMESMAALRSGKLDPLSVQEVIDCAGLGNSGCAGGDICLLLDWLALTKSAVVSEKQYPLKLYNGVCQLKKNATGVRISTFTCDDFVSAEDKILEALATHGPVAVAVNALTWQNYLGGVIQYHCSGAPLDLNHAVQLVGYDLSAEVPYYIAKNSWGTEFGAGGYLRLAVGANVCGLANEVATVDVV